MKHKWNRNCRSFIGTYPCEISVAENLLDCTDCSFYEPIQKRILIIKLGALGDVLRTIPILKGIKEKYGYETHITWLIEKGSKELLYNIPEIDRIFEDTPENIQRIKQEKFDILLSLEIDAPGTVIANTIDADEKYGYFLDKDGHPSLFNKEATDYLEMALSNKLKLNNKKTYQEHIFDLCCIPYKKQTYSLQLTEKEKQYAAKFFQENNIDANWNKCWICRTLVFKKLGRRKNNRTNKTDQRRNNP